MTTSPGAISVGETETQFGKRGFLCPVDTAEGPTWCEMYQSAAVDSWISDELKVSKVSSDSLKEFKISDLEPICTLALTMVLGSEPCHRFPGGMAKNRQGQAKDRYPMERKGKSDVKPKRKTIVSRTLHPSALAGRSWV